jgi:molybdenum ABC transporter molybdate-binding protein
MNRRFLLAALLSIAALAVLTLLMRDEPLSIFGGGSPQGEKLVVFCAAGIRPPIEDILNDYRREYGVHLQTTYAGSGDLLSKLRLTEADVYVAADRDYALSARRAGLVREIMPLAFQKLVIAVKRGNPLKIATLQDLTRDDVRVSLANPEVTAIGKIVQDKLAGDPIWEAVWEKRTVEKSTVNDVANDVKTGAVDAGIVWDTTAAPIPDIEAIDAPELDELESDICIGVVAQSARPSRALHFARYASARDKGLLHFGKRGYRVARGDKWAEKPVLNLSSGALNRPAIERTIEEFKRREGLEITTSFEGCGKLVAKMKAGDRPDVYFACERSFMDMVRGRDALDLFLEPHDVSRTPAVIIAAKGNPKRIEKLEDLTREGLRIALCDPEFSALGALTDKLLEKRGILEQVRRNVHSRSETADICLQAVVVGGLDAAIVYRANTIQQRQKLEVIAIDDPLAYAVQPIALARNSDYPNLAARLMEAILSAQSREEFEQNGFEWLDRGWGHVLVPPAKEPGAAVGRDGG